MNNHQSSVLNSVLEQLPDFCPTCNHPDGWCTCSACNENSVNAEDMAEYFARSMGAECFAFRLRANRV
jgi:hypothetical protein